MDTLNNNILLYWNAQSLSDNLTQLKVLLYSTKPILVFISETWFTDYHQPYFVNYIQLRQDRLLRGGGVIFLIRQDLVYSSITLNPFQDGHIEALAIDCTLKGMKCSIMGVYNPQSKFLTTAELSHYYSQLPQQGSPRGHI